MDAAVVNSLRDYQRRNRLRVDGAVSAATGQALPIWPGSPAAAGAVGLDGDDPTAAPAAARRLRDHGAGPPRHHRPGRPVRRAGPRRPRLPVRRAPTTTSASTASTRSRRSRPARASAPTASSAPPPARASGSGRRHRPAGRRAGTDAAAAGAFGLPANSGSGRRVVYSRAQQRVWAVEADGTVVKTHRVSGRLREPYAGTYHVYSRSMYTYSTENPDVKWRYMVRFAYGPGGGRIGFHEIPNKNGVPLQSVAPARPAAVRRLRPPVDTDDAIWMWNWAGLGTTVVVL